MIEINVQLGHSSYPIRIGTGVLPRIGAMAKELAPHERAMLVVDAAVESTHGRVARESMLAAGFEVSMQTVIAEERRKSLDAVGQLYESMAAARLERNSPIVAVGGGITGDVAGFAAATYLRGVPVVHVPTTLLAMVDASVGGKTGVNLHMPGAAGALGKNLVGAFWQPRAVLIDPATLTTLPERHFRCGLAECVKHALVADPSHLAFIEKHVDAIKRADENVLRALIETSVRIKAAIVMEDERETGKRALLNLGHTFGHAIESIAELQLLHGEAVAAGIVAAFHAAVTTGRTARTDLHRVEDVLSRLGLPTRLTTSIDAARLMQAMRMDKKVSHGHVRLVLPSGIGRADLVSQVPDAVVMQAWEYIGAGATGGQEGIDPA